MTGVFGLEMRFPEPCITCGISGTSTVPRLYEPRFVLVFVLQLGGIGSSGGTAGGHGGIPGTPKLRAEAAGTKNRKPVVQVEVEKKIKSAKAHQANGLCDGGNPKEKKLVFIKVSHVASRHVTCVFPFIDALYCVGLRCNVLSRLFLLTTINFCCGAADGRQTHKTGSSTITNILHRVIQNYGYSPAVPTGNLYYAWFVNTYST